MNRTKLKNYAPQARKDFIQAVTAKAAQYGLTASKIEPMTEKGDVVLISGKPFPKAVGDKRKRLEDRIKKNGFEYTMEAMAYTWFNRLVAVRYMELHGYLEHGFRVLSHPEGHAQPEILEKAQYVDLPGLDQKKVIELKLDGTKEEYLYRLLLTAQFNALSKAMTFLFKEIDDETELLLPDNLLNSDSLIRKLVTEIDEEDWKEVEIIGWLYQFYISDKKDEVIGKVVKSEDIPAATQLFTPNWIVKYLVQNTIGRQWLATYPQSSLRSKMEYYIEPAEQTLEVQEQLKAITPTSLNPEELTLLDPACGSGHILVEAYDLFKAIYEERGYRSKDIPALILQKNLFGLEIDDRAAQLAAFALMMKARADYPRIFDSEAQPNVVSFVESKGLDAEEITEALNEPIWKEHKPPSGTPTTGIRGDVNKADVSNLLSLFENGKTFGSLIKIPDSLAVKLPVLSQRVADVAGHGEIFDKPLAKLFAPFCKQAALLSQKYDAVVMNPPYMGGKGMIQLLKEYVTATYPQGCADLFAAFIERGFALAKPFGFNAMITMQSWMFLSSFEQLRTWFLASKTLLSLAHLGPRAFSTISGEVVQTVAFSAMNHPFPRFVPTFFRLTQGDETAKSKALLERRDSYQISEQRSFAGIPGSPIAYWASPSAVNAFATRPSFGDECGVKQGLATAHDDRFLRYWHEVSVANISFDSSTADDAKLSGCKWFPFSKGGTSRRWYGNNEYLVNWKDDGAELKAFRPRSVIRNESYYFRRGGTWSLISGAAVSFRELPAGFIIGHKGPAVYPKSSVEQILGYLNSCVALHFLGLLSPNLGVEIGNVTRLPAPSPEPEVQPMVAECIRLSKDDWDASETSWNFRGSPLLVGSATVSQAFERLVHTSQNTIRRMCELESAINTRFIAQFGMESDFDPAVFEDQVTLYRPNREEEIRRLVSYFIGCMMGRYSLDEPGIVYAHSGNKGFDHLKYKTFSPDGDGIVPVTEFNWFPDDAASRFESFLSSAWSTRHLEENMRFVAEGLGPKKGETPRETIRRYLAVDFFKHHVATYKKRPIYWLFSSGKLRGFQALVYLHRYNEGTLARIRTEYIIPLIGKFTARISQLADDISASSSSQHKKRLESEKATLTKQLAEVQSYDEKVRHFADRKVALDLDEGVAANYEKLSGLLAEISLAGKIAYIAADFDAPLEGF